MDNKHILISILIHILTKEHVVIIHIWILQILKIINWKIEASGPRPAFAESYAPYRGAKKGKLEQGKIKIYDGETGESKTSSIIDRYVLKSGETVQGPALIQEDETTTVLDASDEITVDVLGNLVAEIRYTGV